MDLKALLLCSDEKIVRVLRRTLGDLEIGVEHCTSSEAALRHLTRERFEAIIVDCAGPGAAAVLRSARVAPCNKRAVAVAILDNGVGLRSAYWGHTLLCTSRCRWSGRSRAFARPGR